MRVVRFLASAMIAALCACGGGSSPTAPAPTPSPTPQLSVTTFASTAVGPGGLAQVQFPLVPGAMSGIISLPPATAVANVAFSLSNTAPSALPAVPQTVLAYFTAQSSATTHFGSSIGATVVIPGVTIVAGNQYLLLYDPTNPAAGWNAISGPGSPPTGPLEGENKGALTLQQGVQYDLVLVTTQGTLVVPPTVP